MKKSFVPFLAAVTAIASMLAAYFSVGDMIPFRISTVPTNTWAASVTNIDINGFVESFDIVMNTAGSTADVYLITVTNSSFRLPATLFVKTGVTSSGRYLLRYNPSSSAGVSTSLFEKAYFEGVDVMLRLSNAAPSNLEVMATLVISKEG